MYRRYSYIIEALAMCVCVHISHLYFAQISRLVFVVKIEARLEPDCISWELCAQLCESWLKQNEMIKKLRALWPEPMRMYVCDQVCDLTVLGNEVLDGDNSDQKMVLDNMI